VEKCPLGVAAGEAMDDTIYQDFLKSIYDAIMNSYRFDF
jgi:hypothetical protein